MVRLIDNYTLVEKIGQGSYGEVYRAVNSKKNGEFAVKVIPNQKFIQNNLLQQCTLNQIKILSTLSPCDYIVRYQEHFKTRNNYYFVYQYCNGGTLLEAVRKEGHFSEKKSLLIFKQLVEAFKILNRFNIMHRDLKPQNIFFHNGKVKLGDFGFCKGLEPGQNMAKTMLGSPIYMAPQVLRGQNYSTKADIWSLGVVLYQMMFGICPFQSNSIAMLINTINSTDLSMPLNVNKVSQKSINLIKRLLTKDYFRRISWVQIFTFKIDQQGNFVQNQQPYNYPSTNKSFSSIKDQAQKTAQINKKPNSTPKDHGKMTVYSQRYLNAVSQPLTICNNRVTQKKISLSKQDFSQKIRQQIFDKIGSQRIQFKQKLKIKNNQVQSKISSVQIIEMKRTRLLKKHQKCLQILKQSLNLLQKRQVSLLKDIFSQLNKVQNMLKQITQQIKISQTDLLDVASLINYQIIQVDRQIIDTKQQMMKHNIDINKQSKIVTIKSLEGNTSQGRTLFGSGQMVLHD